jgi:hydroxyacylglutathione hydrolase
VTHIHPIHDDVLGNTSYLVDLGDGMAACIDPRRDVGDHLELAKRSNLRIVASIETHLHADFISGSREIAEAVGAEVIAANDAHLRFPHRPVEAGQAVRLGRAELRSLATPGHTLEHLAYVLSDNDVPRAVFTGGSLIHGGAGRTDLSGAERTEDLARAQYRSMRVLADLPDETHVYPTHGAGSFCSTLPGSPAGGTIGDERRTNPLLAIDDEDRFVAALLAGFGSFPSYFNHLRELNRMPDLVRDVEPPRALEPLAAYELMDAGAILVDARPVHEWAAGHPSGAISIELRPAFASWLGWVVPFGDPVVLLVDRKRRAEALRQARLIGFDAVVGWIDGEFAAWTSAGLPVSEMEEVDAREADRRARSGVALLDVRQRAELAGTRLPGAEYIELGDIIAGKVPDAREVITFCGHGERAATAASLLQARGMTVANLFNGLVSWEDEGLAVER